MKTVSYIVEVGTVGAERSKTNWIATEGRTSATVMASAHSGSGTGWTLTVERSNDASSGYGLTSATTLTADTMSSRIDLRGFSYIRARLTTGASSAAQANVVFTLTNEPDTGA